MSAKLATLGLLKKILPMTSPGKFYHANYIGDVVM